MFFPKLFPVGRRYPTHSPQHDRPVFQFPGERRGPSGYAKPYLEFKNVSISFGENRVLDNVSFRVMPEETACILGKSGVGKSVCLRILMGFLKPDSGRVTVAQQDITSYTEEQMLPIRKQVTMVFQNGALFDSLSLSENVAFPLRERGVRDEQTIYSEVEKLLDMVGVPKHMRDQLPSEISTGMKRSVAIARALAGNPEAVLYDEPTTMTDPLMSRRLTKLIHRLNVQRKLTSVVVTHDMRLAEDLADQVIFLDQGRVVFLGTVPEMERSTVPIVREFLELDRIDLRSLLGPAGSRGLATG